MSPSSADQQARIAAIRDFDVRKFLSEWQWNDSEWQWNDTGDAFGGGYHEQRAGMLRFGEALKTTLLDALATAQAATEQPDDPTGHGRLLLNAYGRQCFDAGRLAAQAAQPSPCEWRERVHGCDVFIPGCDSRAHTVSGTAIRGFGFRFCPHCGKPIKLPEAPHV